MENKTVSELAKYLEICLWNSIEEHDYDSLESENLEKLINKFLKDQQVAN